MKLHAFGWRRRFSKILLHEFKWVVILYSSCLLAFVGPFGTGFFCALIIPLKDEAASSKKEKLDFQCTHN